MTALRQIWWEWEGSGIGVGGEWRTRARDSGEWRRVVETAVK